MSKIFDFIDTIVSFFQWIVNFISQMFIVVTNAVPIVTSLLKSVVVHAPVLYVFFYLFFSVAVLLFIWRLIP